MFKKLAKGNTVAIALIVWALVILAIALGAFILKPWQTKSAETISVTADGKTQVAPNIAQISATISTENLNLDKTQMLNEEKVNNLISDLNNLGVEEKDIKTTSISGGETYEIQIYPPPNRGSTNQISTTFEVTIRDFAIANNVIATFTQNGATNIYGPNLTVADETLEEAKSEARKDAVVKAKKKAQELAQELDKSVGEAVSVSEQGDFRYPQPIPLSADANFQEEISQIQPGQNEVSVTIQVEFELR